MKPSMYLVPTEAPGRLFILPKPSGEWLREDIAHIRAMGVDTLVSLLEPADLPAAFLAALKSKAERNRRLILASLNGVTAAEAQIARIDAAQGALRTYSPEGAPVEAAPPRVTRDTRA